MFRGRDGGLSNSRIIADVLILYALLMSTMFIVIGFYRPDVDLMKIATAVGVLFASIAGTAMTFLFFQKKNEVKEQEIKSDCNDSKP